MHGEAGVGKHRALVRRVSRISHCRHGARDPTICRCRPHTGRRRGSCCATAPKGTGLRSGHAAPRTSGTQFFHLSRKHCASFLDPLIRLLGHRPRDIRPGHRLERQGGLRYAKRFEFIQPGRRPALGRSARLTAFPQDSSLSRSAIAEEVGFLKRLRFKRECASPCTSLRAAESERPAAFSTRRGLCD